MIEPSAVETEQIYRIGAVSRLTGVPADTLRVWERRYQVVTPIRSDAGTRLYASEDVGRLTLIKRLVDHGDAISSVANLSLEGLRERMRGTDSSEAMSAPGRPCRAMVYGPTLAERLRCDRSELDGIECVGLFTSREAFLEAAPSQRPDVAVFEFPTIHADQVREIGQLFVHSGAARAILIYGFASRATLARLDSSRMVTRRAPIDVAELRHWCLAMHLGVQVSLPPPEETEIDMILSIPPRVFTDAELGRIAVASPSGHCECPRHLVDLVSSLTTFERYSEECEIRHHDDAALHAFLHFCAARARALMETALARVAAAEGGELDPGDCPTSK